ncbi:MAG TPA: MFS transporter [Mycobacteriales bacterium]|nr:MFS transporter [Mycobacteriales bacterium]
MAENVSTPPADHAGEQPWLTRGVGGIAAASLLSDVGHETATAVLPSFVTTVLHSSAAALGAIEGFSDAAVGVAKMIGGPLANDGQRRIRIATGGYLGTAAFTGTIGAASAIWQVGVLRALAWASRGIRSPSRDTLLASLTPPHAYGRAYGLERAGDNLGAVAGPLLAAGLVAWLGIRPAIYFAYIPGVLAAIAITVAGREARRRGVDVRGKARAQLSGLRDAGLVRPLLPIALFECGNVATTLLILRATQQLTTGGRSAASAASLAITLYAAHNAVGSGLALVAGRWIDRAGPRIVFAVGAIGFAAGYAGFAVGPHAWWWLLVAFVFAGGAIGLAETAESTLVAQILPDRLRGSGFGVLGGIQAGGDIIATVVAGALYTAVSPAAAFAYAGAWMVASVLTTTQLQARPRPPAAPTQGSPPG